VDGPVQERISGGGGKDGGAGRGGSGRGSAAARAAAFALLAAGCAVAGAMAFLAAWRQVRSSPALVDGWPGGDIGFGLSCGIAVLAGRTGLLRALRRARRAHRADRSAAAPPEGAAARRPWCGALARASLGAVLSAGVAVLGLVYGLAVVPPRWCYQSLNPGCAALPGAAEAGLAFLAVLIAAFFAGSAVSASAWRTERAAAADDADAPAGTLTCPAPAYHDQETSAVRELPRPRRQP
jgi:hypothetical protein